MTKLLIFHNILPGCQEGDPEAWRAFLENYTPAALQAFSIYTPWSAEARCNGWREALGALSADGFAALKAFSHQSEREFLVGLRAFLQDWATAKLVPSQDAAHPAAPEVETIRTLLADLPLVHQEIAFLTLAGYSQPTIEAILRITPGVAKEGLGRLQTNYAEVLQRNEDRCLWPHAWIGICKTARAAGQNGCPSLRQLIRILDGQASWYDKTPAETHRAKCLHCLELWTALLEVVAWDRSRQPWTAEKIEPFLAVIPLAQRKRKRSLFGRVLGS